MNRQISIIVMPAECLRYTTLPKMDTTFAWNFFFPKVTLIIALTLTHFLILLSGALVDVEDDLGRNPLHYATRSLDCVEMLANSGISLNEKDKNGCTSLFYGSFTSFVL
jgi:hypothetical protein